MSNLRPYADLKEKVGEYTDKEGKTKGVWVDVGTLFASPHMSHMFIKIKAIPVGDFDGTVSVFRREDALQALDGIDVEPSDDGNQEIKF